MSYKTLSICCMPHNFFINENKVCLLHFHFKFLRIDFSEYIGSILENLPLKNKSIYICAMAVGLKSFTSRFLRALWTHFSKDPKRPALVVNYNFAFDYLIHISSLIVTTVRSLRHLDFRSTQKIPIIKWHLGKFICTVFRLPLSSLHVRFDAQMLSVLRSRTAGSTSLYLLAQSSKEEW